MVRTAWPWGRNPRCWGVGEGVRREAQVSRMCAARECDVWREAGGQRGADALHPLETFERSERSEAVARGDDAGGQGGPDAGEGLELGGGGAVEVHLRRRRGRGTGGRGGTRDEGRVHGRQLAGEGLAVRGRDGGLPPGATAADGETKRRHRGHKQQGASLGWRRHPLPYPRATGPPAPIRCARAQISRSTAIATSPTICSVRCDTLSSVSSGVWCQG